jgi:hypothetical protein
MAPGTAAAAGTTGSQPLGAGLPLGAGDISRLSMVSPLLCTWWGHDYTPATRLLRREPEQQQQYRLQCLPRCS